MNLICKTLCLTTLTLGALPCAHAGTDFPATVHEQKGWRVEPSDSMPSILNAQLDGKATHAGKNSTAILQVTCYGSPRRPWLALLAPTARLEFVPDLYEGPDARSTGPLTLTTGASPTSHYSVNGFYSAAYSQDSTLIFEFDMQANQNELRQWVSDTAQGQLITMTLPSSLKNQPPLVAEFFLPKDNSGLRKLVKPCLAPKRPKET